METDPKGQLGGLESSDAVRRRLAAESHGFKCPSCGKTNAEIMQECTRVADSCPIAKQDIEIPSELSLAWKDEMTDRVPLSTGRLELNDASRPPLVTAQAPRLESTTSTANATPTGLTNGEAVSGVSATTRGELASNRVVSLSQQQHLLETQVHAELAPLWVDRVILIIIGTLIAILIKVFIL